MKGYWKILCFIFGITSIGFLAFVIPGIMFAIWFSSAVCIFLVEDLEGMDALLASRLYVQGYWIAVVGRYIFLSLICLICYLPLGIVQGFHNPIASEVTKLLITTITLPIASIYGFLIYGNLRLLKPNISTVTEALKANHSDKVKMKLFVPSLVKGAISGLPLVILALYFFIVRPVVVAGNSMAPSYINNEYLIADLLFYNSHAPERGDVIVLRSPTEPNKLLIKRVIGLSGERVKIKFGEIFINTEKIDEKTYLPASTMTSNGPFLQDSYELPIPQGQYLVLGDNRKDSSDSREWGFIRKSDVVGKVGMCLWNCPPAASKK